MVKFICKDVWASVFGKGAEKLRTDRAGTYVLNDSSHPPLLLLSGAGGDTDAQAAPYLMFTAGLMRGALGAFGADASVTAKAVSSHCEYHIFVRHFAWPAAQGGEGAAVSGSA